MMFVGISTSSNFGREPRAKYGYVVLGCQMVSSIRVGTSAASKPRHPPGGALFSARPATGRNAVGPSDTLAVQNGVVSVVTVSSEERTPNSRAPG